VLESSKELSRAKHYLYGRWMTKSLINIASVYKDLCEKEGIKIDWGNNYFYLRQGEKFKEPY